MKTTKSKKPVASTTRSVACSDMGRRLEEIADRCCDLKWDFVRKDSIEIALLVQSAETAALTALAKIGKSPTDQAHISAPPSQRVAEEP